MTAVVSLRNFVGEMQILNQEIHSYLNQSTGELITIPNDYIDRVKNDEVDSVSEWEVDLIEEAKRVQSSDDFLELPGKFEINDYEIMERFCLSISDERISDVLLGKIRGSGAFQRFRETIDRYDLEEEWFKFKDDAYKEIAIWWLKNHGIAYVDDVDQ